jgi:hypothetical protein
MITLLIGIAALLGGLALGSGLCVLRKPPPVSQFGEDKNFKRHFRRAAPAVRLAGGRMPQSIAARRGTAMRGLNRRLRRRYAEGLGAFPGRGPRSGSSGAFSSRAVAPMRRPRGATLQILI